LGDIRVIGMNALSEMPRVFLPSRQVIRRNLSQTTNGVRNSPK